MLGNSFRLPRYFIYWDGVLLQIMSLRTFNKVLIPRSVTTGSLYSIHIFLDLLFLNGMTFSEIYSGLLQMD